MTMPPTTSAWPLMNFVTEWSTTSAPRSRGFWRQGLAKVLSTTSKAPQAWAISAAAAMSVTCMAGLEGDSMYTMRVLGRMAAFRLPRSVVSTYEDWTPKRLKYFSMITRLGP